MARPLRIEYPGAYYHVMNRGLARSNIFLDDNDRQRFLGLIGETSKLGKVEVYAYCLMANQFHAPRTSVSRPDESNRLAGEPWPLP